MAELIGILSSSGGLIGSLSGASLSGSLAGVIPMLQEKSHTPTETATTVTADEGFTGLSKVDVGAIPSDYVGSDIPRQTELHITANSITAPAGFYAEDILDSVQTGTEGTPTASKSAVDPDRFSVTVTPSVTNTEGYISGGTHTGTPVTVAATELVSGTKLITENVNSSNVSTYKYVRVNVQPSLQTQSATPSETAQTITADSGYYGMDKVNVSAIPSDYVGSAITARSSLNVSGATVSADAGYYSASTSASVQSGTAGNPTAQKGTPSGGSVTVTPKVTNTTGYITGGTKTGTAVTVSASELVSGTKSITANTSSDDVTNYKYVDVTITPNLQTKSLAPDETAHTVQADAGYDGLEKVNVSAISSTYVGSAITTRTSVSVSGRNVTANAGYYPSAVTGSVATATGGTPTATKSAVSNHAITVTPKVTNPTGYITASTITGTAVTVSASELVSGTKSITANTTSSDVTNYKYVDVSVSGGLDLPKFTLTQSGGGVTVTCDKTFAECLALVNDGVNYAIAEGNSEVAVNVMDSDLSTYITYSFAIIGASQDITYRSNGTITASETIVPQRDSSDLTVSGATVTAPAGLYESSASTSVASGTAGTPTASKGAVNNHAITVTPSVTNTTGYITGGTKTGTGVSVSASEVVSGTMSITANTTSADVTNYKYVDVSVSGGGGATNFITGSFKTTATTGTVQAVTLPYTGSGYPIAAMVYIKGGAYNNGSGGNTTWYNSTQRYAVGEWAFSKSQQDTTPTYTTSGAANQGVTCWIYKNSTSSATSYSRSSAMTTNVLTSSNATNAGATCVRFKSATSLSVFVASTSYGLLANTDYTYQIVYSS